MEKNLNALTVTDIICVYSGIDGKCGCGCAGKYSYHADPALLTAGALRRGYAVSDDEVNPRMIKKVLKIMQDPTNEARVMREGENVSIVIGSRLYVAHFVEGITCTAPPVAGCLA